MPADALAGLLGPAGRARYNRAMAGPRPRDRRVDVNLEFDTLDHMLTEYLTNISRSGAFIRTRDPWPVGSRLRLRFTVMADDPEILEGIAEVVRVSDQPRGMGVEFLELTEQSKRIIDRVLERPGPRRTVSSARSSGSSGA